MIQVIGSGHIFICMQESCGLTLRYVELVTGQPESHLQLNNRTFFFLFFEFAKQTWIKWIIAKIKC